MPGRKWYVVALLLFVIGGAAAGLVVYRGVADLARELPQILVPGEAQLTFSRPGTYTIFFEHQSVIGDRVFSTGGEVPGMHVRLSSLSGAPIALTTPSASTSYSFGNRSGESVLTCEIPQPGQYQFAAAYPDGRSEPQGVMAIGLNVGRKIAGAIFAGLAIGLTTAVVAFAILIRTFLKRRKTTRSATAAA